MRRFAKPEEVDDPSVIAAHRNSENELLTINRVENGAFAGKHVLVIHDDSDAGGTMAPMLLDPGTIGFLLKALEVLRAQSSATQEPTP